jgi:hypothetical protein
VSYWCSVFVVLLNAIFLSVILFCAVSLCVILPNAVLTDVSAPSGTSQIAGPIKIQKKIQNLSGMSSPLSLPRPRLQNFLLLVGGKAFCPSIHSQLLEFPFSIKIRCFFKENNVRNVFLGLFYIIIDN